jgi:hypothetical protein
LAPKPGDLVPSVLWNKGTPSPGTPSADIAAGANRPYSTAEGYTPFNVGVAKAYGKPDATPYEAGQLAMGYNEGGAGLTTAPSNIATQQNQAATQELAGKQYGLDVRKTNVSEQNLTLDALIQQTEEKKLKLEQKKADGEGPSKAKFWNSKDGLDHWMQWDGKGYNTDLGPSDQPGSMSVTTHSDGTMTFTQGAKGSGITADEAKGGEYLSAMENAEKGITDNTNDLTNFAYEVGKDVPYIGNKLKSDSYRHGEQASREFINGIKRRQSGAAIQPAESVDYYELFIPRYGDDQGTLDQKTKSRAVAREGIRLGLPESMILSIARAGIGTTKESSGGSSATGIPSLPGVPSDAVNMLLKDPSSDAQKEFDDHFGVQGGAASILRRYHG